MLADERARLQLQSLIFEAFFVIDNKTSLCEVIRRSIVNT
jgi:hypothetical protein